MSIHNTSLDHDLMQRAVLLGEKGRLTAPPNPWVGCILVKNGTIVGEGFHRRAGDAHAEVNAIQQAGLNARGSTAYVTLEPCSHHGATPPCSRALVTAGVARVVVALVDPDPRVSGKGIAELRQAGFAVSVGVGAEAAQQSLKAYLHHRRTQRPYCVSKIAVSVDGRIAAQDGTSRWITDAEARADAHRLRAESQAIMIGSGTALRDRPSLTVRDCPIPDVRHPLRIVLDAKGIVPAQGPLFDTSIAATLVVTTEQAPKLSVKCWQDTGAEVAYVPAARDGVGVDLDEALKLIGRRGILQLLIEGGASLHSSLMRQRLIDQLVVYTGPRLLGEMGKPLFQGLDIPSIDEAPLLELTGLSRHGSSIRTDYKLV